MDTELVRILLVEDNPWDADLLKYALEEAAAMPHEVVWVRAVAEALERLIDDHFDVVLLDLSLPDSEGIEAVVSVHSQAPDLPIVVLAGAAEAELAARAMQAGAQDHIVKGQQSGHPVVRAIRYALERHRIRMELHELSFRDDLTGLYNRRGFLTVAGQEVTLAKRIKRGLLLLFVDLDHLKQINDQHGHRTGDLALIEVAAVLKETFRESDVIGRLGGDEFVVLTVDVDQVSVDILTRRLQEVLAAHNREGKLPCDLSLSVGAAHCDSERPCSIDTLLSHADLAMYEDKRKKSRGS